MEPHVTAQVHLSSAHLATVHALGVTGVSWTQIWAWISMYGLPLFLQAVALFGSGGMSGLTVQQIIDFITAALAALKGGTPVPPLPTPAK